MASPDPAASCPARAGREPSLQEREREGTTEPRTNRETTMPSDGARRQSLLTWVCPISNPVTRPRGAFGSVLIESAAMGRLRSFEGRKLRDALDVRRI